MPSDIWHRKSLERLISGAFIDVFSFILQERWHTEVILESSRLYNYNYIQKNNFYGENFLNIFLLLIPNFILGFRLSMRCRGAVLFDLKILQITRKSHILHLIIVETMDISAWNLWKVGACLALMRLSKKVPLKTCI